MPHGHVTTVRNEVRCEHGTLIGHRIDTYTPVAPPAPGLTTTQAQPQGHAAAPCACGAQHTPDDPINLFGVNDGGPDDDPDWGDTGPTTRVLPPPPIPHAADAWDGPSDDPAW